MVCFPPYKMVQKMVQKIVQKMVQKMVQKIVQKMVQKNGPVHILPYAFFFLLIFVLPKSGIVQDYVRLCLSKSLRIIMNPIVSVHTFNEL